MRLKRLSSESCGQHGAWDMNLSWILLGLVGWGIALLFVLLLMRMAGDQDRSARHEQKRIDPLADVTITKIEDPTKTR
jgi:hypothetical protein